MSAKRIKERTVQNKWNNALFIDLHNKDSEMDKPISESKLIHKNPKSKPIHTTHIILTISSFVSNWNKVFKVVFV